MKRKTEDIIFSQYIRLRDNYTCQRCGSKHKPNSGGLHCSHYFGRARKSVRWDERNCDSLCYGCHMIWGSKDKEGYREFMIQKLTQKGFDQLTKDANTTRKWTKEEIKELRKHFREKIKLVMTDRCYDQL